MTVIQNINRDDIYQDVVELITHSPENESEISLVDLATKYGISSPTIDYHIKKLVEEGKIIQTENRGRYNRKKYKLPESDLQDLHRGLEGQQSFIDFIEEKNEVTTIEGIDMKTLPLNEHINEYLEKVNGTISSESVLVKNDKEILSVTVETLQQTMVFIKDILDQLSTTKTKELIFRLIEERNDNLETIKKLEEQVLSLKEQIENMPKESPVDPQRIRFMQQILLSTVDSFVNQSNVSMTMNRKEFKEQAIKEIKDLVDYALGITS